MEGTGESSTVSEMEEEPRAKFLKQYLTEDLQMDYILSRPFDRINEVCVDRQIWKLPTRIVNLWYEEDNPNEHHIEMVVMDSNCDRIQIVIPARYVPSWSKKIVEQQTYVFNNFKVEENDLLSRGCHNPFKLLWFDGTFISNEYIPAIPDIKFFFKDFGEILGGNCHPDDIHDIIGMVHEVTFHQRNECKLPIVSFILKDINQVLLECLLWGNHASTFLNGVRHDVGVEPNVVIIRNAVMFEAYGFSPISIGNGSHGTRVFTDQSISEIVDYKHSFPANDEPLITIRIGNVCSNVLVENEQDYSGFDGDFLRLKELNDLDQEFVCVTIGITNKINVTRSGWTYDGCAWCSKVVFVSEGVLKCGNNHVNSIVTPRYKLDVEVTYEEDKSIFVFPDSACANFYGMSAFQLKKNLNSVDQADARFYPLLLDSILGIKMVAKVKWSPTFRSNFVEFFSTDQHLMQLMESKLS